MRYEVLIELIYLGGRENLPAPAGQRLTTAIVSEMADRGDGRCAVVDLEVTASAGDPVVVRAVLQGATPADLTSPLEALTLVDTSLDRALFRCGLFEEFDVAGKILRATPARTRASPPARR